MRRATKAAIVGTVVIFAGAFFFLAPVSYAGYLGQPAAPKPVYQSLGCSTVGFGDLYAPNMFGLSFGCQIPANYLPP
jgi:hypothetical protein